MSLLENHFSDRILSVMSPSTRQSIAFGRDCSDESALDLFVRELSASLAVFDIDNSSNRISARRVHGISDRGDLIEADSANELQDLMSREISSALNPPKLIERYRGYKLYRHRGVVKAVPRSYGRMDLRETLERSRVLSAPTVEAARSSVDTKYKRPLHGASLMLSGNLSRVASWCSDRLKPRSIPHQST
jgi:hypothetical protein